MNTLEFKSKVQVEKLEDQVQIEELENQVQEELENQKDTTNISSSLSLIIEAAKDKIHVGFRIQKVSNSIIITSLFFILVGFIIFLFRDSISQYI